jgi:hypothetical protein
MVGESSWQVVMAGHTRGGNNVKKIDILLGVFWSSLGLVLIFDYQEKLKTKRAHLRGRLERD